MLYFGETLLPKLCTKRWYKGMERSMVVKRNTVNDWVGILKLFSVLFIMSPCCAEKVCSCARQQFIMIVLADMGSRPRNIFVSSTSAAVMVSSHNALSRKLHYFV